MSNVEVWFGPSASSFPRSALGRLIELIFVQRMMGSFASIPTGCPQRNERLGWTGDLALFALTAAYIYQCTGILRNWHLDLAILQKRRDGLPLIVCPDPLEEDRFRDLGILTAIWYDVTVLGPWTVYQATGNVEILRTQYEIMQGWFSKTQ